MVKDVAKFYKLPSRGLGYVLQDFEFWEGGRGNSKVQC